MPDGFERGGAMSAAITQQPAPPASPPAPPPSGAPRQNGSAFTPQGQSAPHTDGGVPPGVFEDGDLSWRDRMAGDNTERRKFLERYADEQSFGRAHFELLRRMSAGELRQSNPFPERGTPEEQVNWRKANGVPESDAGYQEKLAIPNGVVLGEMDKEGIGQFAKAAHGKNWTQSQFNDAVGMWYGVQDHLINQRDQQDAYWHEEAEDKLRQDWPSHEYRQNVSRLHNYLNTFDEQFRRDVLGGRTASGRLLGDDPRFLHLWLEMAQTLNPQSSVVPGGMSMEAYQSRRKEIEGWMRDVNSPYYTGPDAASIRAEYTRMIEQDQRVEERMARRGGG